MRAVIQRVTQASVTVAGVNVGSISTGLLVLLGVEAEDTLQDAQFIAAKSAALRIFNDDAGLMNRSVKDIGGGVLVVSQFTLLGDVRKGNRPGFTSAAAPTIAEPFYQRVCQLIADQGIRVAQGQFQADMQVSLINDGPVTILLDSRKRF